MDTFKEVIQLIRPNCFFTTIDLKDTCFSVYVNPDERKWLRFLWKSKPFQFTCQPQGLKSAPRTFTKWLKPALCHLRKLSIVVICYIDDCLFIADSVEELTVNVIYAMQFFLFIGTHY